MGFLMPVRLAVTVLQ